MVIRLPAKTCGQTYPQKTLERKKFSINHMVIFFFVKRNNEKNGSYKVTFHKKRKYKLKNSNIFSAHKANIWSKIAG
jgi:hypothetical protein